MDSLKIVHIFPDLLNLYGDGGNVICLKKRCEWRNIPVEVVELNQNDSVDLSSADIIFMGGGPDREQRLASKRLLAMKEELGSYIEDSGVLLAICGGFQILGHKWLLGDEEVEGLGVVDMETRRPSAEAERLIENIILRSELCEMPVVGYENHAGRTFLGESIKPFGKVISNTGHGNNDIDKQDGVLYKNVVGTYLHGPLLGKNPQVADVLIQRALDTKAKKSGTKPVVLSALDDSDEAAANAYMCKRLGVR